MQRGPEAGCVAEQFLRVAVLRWTVKAGCVYQVADVWALPSDRLRAKAASVLFVHQTGDREIAGPR